MIAVLCILALPKEDNYIYDAEGDLEAFDEPTFVTNSEMGFFYKRDQLSTYRKQKQPDKVKNIKIAENIVTTDFTKNEVTVLPDMSTSYTGSRKLIMYGGALTEYVGVSELGYMLKGGAQVPAEDSFEVILSSGVLGHSSSTPHRIIKGNTYYAAFTERLESIYFEFETSNEFLSVVLSGLSGRIEYELYDSSMNTITTVYNAKETVEIQYKGRGAAKYYLRVTGSYDESIKPFSVKLSSDDNEWRWQMPYPEMNTEITGRFDYYGDDDYFVLPTEITEEINKSVVRFTKAAHDINVVIYDKDHKMLGQYVYDAEQPESISMYGLDDAYAMSVYSYNGENSGTDYAFIFEHTDITVLDVETFGFELKPGFTEEDDYYTACVQSLDEKKITDVMYSPKEAEIKITVTQQCGYSETVALGEDLPLMPGRNTVELSVTIANVTRTVTIVITDPSYAVQYGTMNQKVDGLAKGQKVLVIANEEGKLKVQVCTGTKEIGKVYTVSESSVYTGYEETQMPDEYREKINALREKYPNWKFTFVKTGVSLDSYVSSQVGESSRLDNTGKYATREQIEYAVDPINYLDETNIFMFENATYSNSIEYSAEGVKAIWNDENIAYYAMRAGEASGISPYFITARAALESGRGTSALSTGSVTGYKGYYNFFGIGASDDDASNKGGQMAKNMNWNSKRKALIGGAIWIDTYYISNLQPSIYFMKFNPYLSWHQYMTDINAPKKDALQLYNANTAAGTLESEHEFIIPVFE